MTVKDARKFIAVLMVAYPNYKPIDTELAAITWASIAEEYTYQQVNAALNMYMKTDTSGFAPAPGQLIDKIYSITNPEQLNEMEAWALVAKALRNGCYHSLEEYGKLPPAVQKAVGTHEQLRNWALDENFSEEVAKSSFMRSYRVEVKREQELAKMPKDIRKLIESVNQNSYKAQIEIKRQSAKFSNEREESEMRALEDKHEGVSMPDRLKESYAKLFNEE